MEVEVGLRVFGCLLNHVADEPYILVGEEDVFDVVLEVLFLDCADNLAVHFHVDEGIAEVHDLVFDGVDFLDSFVDEKISVLDFLFTFQSARLSAKCFIIEVLNVEFPDDSIIKLKPSFFSTSFLNQRIVMPTVRIPNMNNNTFELVLVVFFGPHLLGLEFRVFLFS